MSRVILSLLILCFFGIAPVFPQQTSSISGFVTDASSGETLLLANILLTGTTRGGTTNNAGYYTLTGLEAGTYILVCRYIGYQPFEQEIFLTAGENRRLDIEMTPDDIVIDEVVVSAERTIEEEARDIGVAQLEIAAVKELPAVLEPDIFRSLQLLPGVKAASDYSSALYVRGGDPGQTMILIDRATVYNPTHVFGFFSAFNPDAVKDVRLYKGGFPASYGGRIGSVLDIYNKDGNRREFEAGLTLGLLASRAFAEGPYSKGSWMIAIRRSTLEPLLAVLDDVEYVPENFYFLDINGKLNLDLSPNNRFSLSFYVGGDILDLEFLGDAELNLDYGNRTLNLNWTHLFSEKLFANFTFTTSRYHSTPTATFGGTTITQDNRIFDFSFKSALEYRPNEKHYLEGGFWGGYLDLPFSTTFDGEESFSPSNRSAYMSAYLQETYNPTPQWTLQGGIRGTFFAAGSHLRLSPRLSAEYEPDSRLRLQASFGRYYQFKTLITSESFSGFDFWLTTAEDVPPAYGDQYNLGAKTTLHSNFTLDTEVYYRTMRDLFVLDPFLADPAGLPYSNYFVVGKGYARGAEAQLNKLRGRLNGFVAYTISKTSRLFPNLNLGLEGEPRYYAPKYDRLHDFTGVANFELTRSWRLVGVFTFSTGQAYTNPQSQYRLVSAWYLTGEETTDVLLSPGLNQARLPAYHRLDIGATKTGRFFGFADYELQLQVINAYARRNILCILNDFQDDNTIARTEVPQLPLPIPNVSLSLQF